MFNNSGVTGLAGSVAARTAHAGWQVVGSDNWYGTIPASTVYYPPRLKAAAHLLALDLGIHRQMPAVDADAARPADRDPDRSALRTRPLSLRPRSTTVPATDPRRVADRDVMG